jgi:hypothetical protein
MYIICISYVCICMICMICMRVISLSFFPLIKLQWAFLCLCIYPQRAWLVGEVEAFLQPKKAIAVGGNFIIQLILTAQCKPNFRNMCASLTSASCVSSSLSFVKGHCSLIIELLPLHLFIFIFALCVFFPLFLMLFHVIIIYGNYIYNVYVIWCYFAFFLSSSSPSK